jgi:hypothetical protein
LGLKINKKNDYADLKYPTHSIYFLRNKALITKNMYVVEIKKYIVSIILDYVQLFFQKQN